MDYIEVCKENMALQQENKQLKERIAELEKENLDLGFETDFIKEKGTCAFCEYLDNEIIKELKEQLAIREKEFIMYLGDIKQHLGANIVERNGYDMIIMNYQDAFHFIDNIITKIEQAKESMK